MRLHLLHALHAWAGATFASLALGRFVFLPFQRDNVKKQVGILRAWKYLHSFSCRFMRPGSVLELMLKVIPYMPIHWRRVSPSRTERQTLQLETGLPRCGHVLEFLGHGQYLPVFLCFRRAALNAHACC